MTQTESAVLLQQSASLAEDFSQLAARLTLTAQALQDPGEPPAKGLIDELFTSQRNFTDLRTRALTLAQSLPISPLPEAETIISLADLKALLWTVKQGEEQKAYLEARRQQALRVLGRVLAIVHRDQIVFPPLLACKERANELHLAVSGVKWPDSHPAIEALVERRHPFSDLLVLIEGQEELDDDQWATLQDAIEQEFGRALAVAASRGKLHVSREQVAESEGAQPAPVFVDFSGPYCDEQQPESAVPRDQASSASEPPSSYGEINAPGSEEEVALLTASVGSGEVEDRAVEETVTVLPVTESEDPTQGLAQDVVFDTRRDEPVAGPRTAEEETKVQPEEQAKEKAEVQPRLTDEPEAHIGGRLSTVRSLMWQLIGEDKSKLAFHIAGYLETQHPELQLRVPSWLVRSAALSRLVRHANGEIARVLKEDYARFSTECFATPDSEWNQAVQFLLITATLQPALLAPHTGASVVLRALQLPEDISQLAQVCRLIAEYGERGEPLDPNTLRKGKEQAVWQTSMDELRRNVEAWCVRSLTASMSYPPATKVWNKWQEPKGVLYALLSPIRRDDASGLAVVKRAVEQLSDDGQIKREVERTDREVLGRRLGDDIPGKALEQIRKYAREVAGFARRWVELQETRAGQNKGEKNQQVEVLRQEVWSRHPLVFEELDTYKRRHPSLPIVGSIAGCQRAFDNIKTLFDPQAPFPAEEPLPRPLLYADLLRIPAVTLNDQWELENIDPEGLIDGILELVANQLPKNGGR